MASTGDEGPILDTAMAQDEDMAQEKVDHPKATYKSFKKKYRKMRIKFDDAMTKSNEYFNQERKAAETAKRLKQFNDELLDFLLDVNDSPQMPVDKRIDLTSEIPALSPIPSLVSTEDLQAAAELQTPEGQALYNEIRTMISEKAASNNASKPLKSLSALMGATPHLSINHPNIDADLMASLEPDEGQTAPFTYLTPDQLDDYLYDIDSSLGVVPPVPPQVQNTPQHDLTFGNFHSPYNWLRRNVPQIFLQDGESSEKSHGKPGALRGAGKRASIPAPSKPDALEFVEEDGIGYDAGLGGPVHAKGKRKREEDDGGYHPKGGRATGEGKTKKPRKKKGDESTPTTSGRKGKGRAKLSSPAPGAHPFGPI